MPGTFYTQVNSVIYTDSVTRRLQFNGAEVDSGYPGVDYAHLDDNTWERYRDVAGNPVANTVDAS